MYNLKQMETLMRGSAAAIPSANRTYFTKVQNGSRYKKAQEPIDADPARNRKKTGLYNMSYDSKLIDWRNHALSEDLQMKSFHL